MRSVRNVALPVPWARRRASASYKLAVAPDLLLRTLRRTREEADQ